MKITKRYMRDKIKGLFIHRLLWIFLILVCIKLESCTIDPLNNTEPGSVSISFQGGPYDGKQLILKTNNEEDDLQFYISKNSSRLYCQPLLSSDNRTLNSKSSLNFAWMGGTQPGSFNLINFLNPSSNTAGNLELEYLDGEYLSIGIPKNTLLDVTEYNGVGEKIVGLCNFQEQLIHELNGVSKVYNVQCFIEFSLQRGADKN